MSLSGAPYDRELLEASLKAREDLGRQGWANVVLGGREVIITGDPLDYALRKANPDLRKTDPDAIISYHASPNVDPFVGGGIAPPFPTKPLNEQRQFLSTGASNPEFTIHSARGLAGNNPGIVAYHDSLRNLIPPGSPTDPLGVKFYLTKRELELLRALGSIQPAATKRVPVGKLGSGAYLYMSESLATPSIGVRTAANLKALAEAAKGKATASPSLPSGGRDPASPPHPSAARRGARTPGTSGPGRRRVGT